MISKTVLRWLTLVALVGLSLGLMVPAASATDISSCPFTISTAGDFVVTKNLTVAGDDCIKVHHDNVSIDLKGHTITGDGTHAGITDNDFFCFQRAIAITNGKIKHFHEGIELDCSELVTIEKIEVTDNAEDGIFVDGCCNSFTDIKANANGDDGVQSDSCCNVFNKIQANDNAAGEGIEEEGCCSTGNQITANDNGDDGILMDDCCSGLSNSQANGNKADGINMNDDDESVANVKANGNKATGIHISGDSGQVTNATANSNGADGIDFGSDDEAVADSVANNNGDIGIDAGNDTFNTVTDVTANHNKTGVSLDCPGNAVNVRAHNNTTTNLSETGGTCTNLNNKI
jgi:parallel beta helix pectate lyase-like protein